jgi:transposase
MDCGCDNKAFLRLNAIHLLLVGASYDIVLRNSRVSDRMFRLWISRFNAQGIDGLTYKPRPGRSRKLEAAKVGADILPHIDDPLLAGETHWAVVKLCGWRREEKAIDLSYRTLVRYLHEHEYVRKIPRPCQSLRIAKLGKTSAKLSHLSFSDCWKTRFVKSSLAMKPGSKGIRGRVINGSSGARDRPRPIRGVTFGRMSSARSIPRPASW